MLELTTDNFDKEVLQSDVPVLVDFWASWCGPCIQMGPVIEALAEEYKDKGVKIGKLNVDDNGDVAARYGIISIPTFILFRGGKEADKMVGSIGKMKLEELLSKNTG
ncbi:MAG: thioredoxin [Patescibacteria group bacterium]